MHDDDDSGPPELVPVPPEALATIELVETFALQAGKALSGTEADLGMATIVLLHLATRTNNTTDRSVTVVALDEQRVLGVLAAMVEVAAKLYGDDAINAIVGALVEVFGADLPPLPTNYGG